MKRIAFKMKLNPGMELEYEKRHQVIWPELKSLLQVTGIHDYSIFLDPTTLDLFGVLKIDSPESLDRLAEHPVMRKWWSYMKDIMPTHPDDSPLSVPLKEVFYLP